MFAINTQFFTPFFSRLFTGLLMVGVLGIVGTTTVQAQEVVDKVVYHIDDSEAQATKALRNIRNHLDVAPKTKIVVVAHANGVNFLMSDAKDAKNPNIDYAALINALSARGVTFEVCEITLKNANLKKEQFVLDANFTPSGVVRITQLQTREGYAYIKP